MGKSISFLYIVVYFLRPNENLPAWIGLAHRGESEYVLETTHKYILCQKLDFCSKLSVFVKKIRTKNFWWEKLKCDLLYHGGGNKNTKFLKHSESEFFRV